MTPPDDRDEKKPGQDVSSIFDGLGARAGKGSEEARGGGEADGDDGAPWARPTAEDLALKGSGGAADGPAEGEGGTDGGEGEGGDVLKIFDLSTGETDTAPAAVPMAKPVTVAEKVKVGSDGDGEVDKEKETAPTLEEMVREAEKAYDNYNYLEASKLVKKVLAADEGFPPARELYTKMYDEHPNLFDDMAQLPALKDLGVVEEEEEEEGAPAQPAIQPASEHHDSHQPVPVRNFSRVEGVTLERREIGTTGLVKTRPAKTTQKVYAAPKTLQETITADEKKGYHEDKSVVGRKGSVAGLMMGVVAIAIIVLALWWTGMI